MCTALKQFGYVLCTSLRCFKLGNLLSLYMVVRHIAIRL